MKMFLWPRAKAIFVKEFKHILRDPFTMFVALLLPVVILLILGNSIEFNVQSIKLAYFDGDRTESSRKLVETFGSSNYFQPYMIDNPDKAFNDIVDERARVALIVPPNFEKEIKSGRVGQAQVMFDGSDNSSIMAVSSYINAINIKSFFKIYDMPSYITNSNLSLKTRYLFNPELNSRYFSVPGIATTIMALVAIILTTLTICREWERGSMEMLLSTPATPAEIIFGKGMPYAILSLAGFAIVFIVARIIFGVPFVGSYWITLLGTTLFILAYLAIGLLISISTRKQEVAVQYAIIIGVLPAMMLSGLIFPVEYMGPAYQVISSVLPARFYMDLLRDQFLRGSHLSYMWSALVYLGISAIVLFTICVARFKRTLE